MVVIIDDRADVWEWSPNLIKVIPCKPIHSHYLASSQLRIDDFFVGIGDINSSFLPKIEPLAPAISTQPPPGKESGTINNGDSSRNPAARADPVDASPAVPFTNEAEIAEEENKAMFTRNNAALDAQLEERPLAKKQEELQEHDDAQQASTSACVKEPSPKPGKLPKKALLKNDDHELERIGKVRYSHDILLSRN